MNSVCMATFNGGRFIKDQISSILSQIDYNDELIISDDSSTDDTISIIKGFHERRIILLENNRFRDPIKNFENALKFARGKFIFLSDQDDIWLDHKYRDTVGLLQKYNLVISDSIVTDEGLNTIQPSFFQFLHSGPGILKNVLKTTYYGSCMAFRQDLLQHALPFPDTKEIGHDLWIGLVAEMTGKVHFCKNAMILYRRHGNTSTQTGIGKSKRTLFAKARGRFIIIKHILRFFINYKYYGKRPGFNHNAYL